MHEQAPTPAGQLQESCPEPLQHPSPLSLGSESQGMGRAGRGSARSLGHPQESSRRGKARSKNWEGLFCPNHSEEKYVKGIVRYFCTDWPAWGDCWSRENVHDSIWSCPGPELALLNISSALTDVLLSVWYLSTFSQGVALGVLFGLCLGVWDHKSIYFRLHRILVRPCKSIVLELRCWAQ